MRKFHSPLKNLGYLGYRWISPIIDPILAVKAFPRYIRFFIDWWKYSKMAGAESIKLINTYPCLHDKTETSTIDTHYFYQAAWATKKIYESKCANHIDIGAKLDFISSLTAITKVTFIDIRPLQAEMENLENKRGNILAMPYENNSVTSVSCLHVPEHIGLGRYGDPLDPLGTKKAAQELTRILAPDGNLYFSLPIGKPRLCFNAHRVHSPQQIIEYFKDLELLELSGVDDSGKFSRNIEIEKLANAEYGCAYFHFTKKQINSTKK